MLALVRDGLDRAVQFFAAFLVIALLTVVTIGIVSRGLNRAFSWTDELSGFLMVWLACFGWMLATRRSAHIRIRYFQDLLPATGRARVEVVMQLGAILLGAVIAWKSIHLMQTNSDVEATTMPIPTAWMYAPLLPAGVLTLVQGVADIVGLMRGTSARSEDQRS